MSSKSTQAISAVASVALAFFFLKGWRPQNIFFDVTNSSGGTLHNIKITPGVAYGSDDESIDSLNDSTIHGNYGNFDGPGDLSVSYSTEDGRTYSSSGPHVTGNEKGVVHVNISGSTASIETKFEGTQQ